MRHHRFEVDQPAEKGGTDRAPTPTEMFVASLAACVAFYARRFLARHGLDEDLDVRATWTMGARPARVRHIELAVDAAVPAEYRERFTRVIEHCTVHESIVVAPEVSITLAGGTDIGESGLAGSTAAL